MNSISILEKTKDYVILRLPKQMADSLDLEKFAKKQTKTEDEVLRKLEAGMAEYYAGQTKKLKSLRDL
ncbi:hypothetical protein A2926_00675 [Candidatus Giovannonibacteria bacterium RIFCSPLOWO2_01_FULL_44_40]|uniref:Uncharacterized protein n=1 Tax=Candidatus Giovannonibacteria bacterium RIFCSPHIGHO2_01_FULL_45_23 TaxID=1798325 RepID=A0A1F5VEP9_9BACT|nr:MAG: hypothetical protein A2834_00180 [Candidatus Giovannonibacteria bacterium RIFCSPHIGHO2_01_FULL_45_23]OGF75191.1 MAG: hypothetical protein A3C77_03865 [Candidatus Giovannonibacteria bacterium RIFCSPHIGHO2_02_FULL_45_13]OGF79594.1 MAG: hypothetical protein A2926_00675 [Candidatus Giovannonibacteria bacterium RIFCSPLOWO2_01_FULL_44_40]